MRLQTAQRNGALAVRISYEEVHRALTAERDGSPIANLGLRILGGYRCGCV